MVLRRGWTEGRELEREATRDDLAAKSMASSSRLYFALFSTSNVPIFNIPFQRLEAPTSGLDSRIPPSGLNAVL